MTTTFDLKRLIDAARDLAGDECDEHSEYGRALVELVSQFAPEGAEDSTRDWLAGLIFDGRDRTATATPGASPATTTAAETGHPVVRALLRLLDGPDCGDVEGATTAVAEMDPATLADVAPRLRRLDGLIGDARFQALSRERHAVSGFKAGDLVRWTGQGDNHPGQWFTARLTVHGGVAGHWRGEVVDPGTYRPGPDEYHYHTGDDVPNLAPALLTLVNRP